MTYSVFLHTIYIVDLVTWSIYMKAMGYLLGIEFEFHISFLTFTREVLTGGACLSIGPRHGRRNFKDTNPLKVLSSEMDQAGRLIR